MSRYANIFEQVGNAKALNNWEANLPVGKHRVALAKYGGKVSGKDKSVFLEAEVIVLETDNADVKIGARHSWPWFINKPDEFGYTHSRAKNFIEVVQACVGNEDDTKDFGCALAADFESETPDCYGIVLEADVVQVFAANGTPRLGKKGNSVFNANWTPIAQGPEDIAATRVLLAELEPAPAAKPQAVKKPKPEVVEQPATVGTVKKLGGLANLIGMRQQPQP